MTTWRLSTLPTRLLAAFTLALTLATGGLPARAETGPTDGELGGGGGRNIVIVRNTTDGALRTRGAAQFNSIPGPVASPVNLAEAYASCTDCDTLAVALQIDLVSTSARQVTPRNYAVALNYACTRCHTIARAYQYVFSVEDPTETPERVRELIAAMDRELSSMQGDPALTLADAEARVDAVVAQFQDLASSLNQQRDEAEDETTPGAPAP